MFVKLSNVALEEGAAFASRQAGTVVELMEAIQTANEKEISRRKKVRVANGSSVLPVQLFCSVYSIQTVD